VSKTSRYGLRIAGIIAIAAAVVGVVVMLHADSHVAGSVVARPFSWIAPLVTVLVIAGVGWILLGQRGCNGAGPDNKFEHTRCPACQREVLGKWRMCPYCGEMIDEARPRALLRAGSDQ